MDPAWQRYADVVTGFTQMAQRHAEQVVRALVRWGEGEASRRERTVEDLLARVDPVRWLGVAKRSDVDRLQDKVSRLEATMHDLGGHRDGVEALRGTGGVQVTDARHDRADGG